MKGCANQLNHMKTRCHRILVHVSFSCLLLYSAALVVDDRCDYNPDLEIRQSRELRKCLSAVSDPRFQHKFEVCKKSICFIYKYEPAFVRFDQEHFGSPDNEKRMQLPFQCKSWRKWHRSLEGIAMELIEETSAREEYCVWAGPSSSCTWNAIVDYTAVAAKSGYQFAIVGPVLELPHRKCEHFAGGSWLDNSLVIIGKPDNAAVNPLVQLTRPFTNGAWIVVGVIVGLFVAVCLIMVWRFHVLQGKSLVTAYFIFMGMRAAALAAGKQINENDLQRGESNLSRKCTCETSESNDLEAANSIQSFESVDTESPQVNTRVDQVVENYDTRWKGGESFLFKFSLATSLFRISLIAFIAMFSLFYEVAVVNFLFQEQGDEITKNIDQLTLAELAQYSVLKDSGLEHIWNWTVNPNGRKFDGLDEKAIPWKRCLNAQECFDWVLDEQNPVQFLVSYELEGTYLIQSRTDCKSVVIYDTRKSLHRFNSGWLFNEKVPEERRRELDRELVAIIMNGRLNQIQNRVRQRCAHEQGVIPSLDFPVLLLPISVLVIPCMLLSAVVAIFSRRNNSGQRSLMYNNAPLNIGQQQTTRDCAQSQKENLTKMLDIK